MDDAVEAEKLLDTVAEEEATATATGEAVFKSPNKVWLKAGVVKKSVAGNKKPKNDAKDVSKIDASINASFIESSQKKAGEERVTAMHNFFENIKVLNRGYDELPGLTVSGKATKQHN